jgi:hypothetical protein
LNKFSEFKELLELITIVHALQPFRILNSRHFGQSAFKY